MLPAVGELPDELEAYRVGQRVQYVGELDVLAGRLGQRAHGSSMSLGLMV